MPRTPQARENAAASALPRMATSLPNCFGQEAHGLQQRWNAAVSFGVYYFQALDFLQAVDGRLDDAPGLVRRASGFRPHGFRQQRGVGINQNAVVALLLDGVQMRTGDGLADSPTPLAKVTPRHRTSVVQEAYPGRGSNARLPLLPGPEQI
jgi:hypothetical protein